MRTYAPVEILSVRVLTQVPRKIELRLTALKASNDNISYVNEYDVTNEICLGWWNLRLITNNKQFTCMSALQPLSSYS